MGGAPSFSLRQDPCPPQEDALSRYETWANARPESFPALKARLLAALKDRYGAPLILCRDWSQGKEPAGLPVVNEVDRTPPPAINAYLTESRQSLEARRLLARLDPICSLRAPNPEDHLVSYRRGPCGLNLMKWSDPVAQDSNYNEHRLLRDTPAVSRGATHRTDRLHWVGWLCVHPPALPTWQRQAVFSPSAPRWCSSACAMIARPPRAGTTG